MRERPILMNATSVNAILSRRQTQDRRPIKPQPIPSSGQWANLWVVKTDGKRKGMACVNATEWDVRYWCQKWCPYRIGDTLWVRETWAPYDERMRGYALDSPEWVVFRADGKMWNTHTHCYGDRGDLIDPDRWRPSIHMPKWATRIWLELVDIRVERVQDITEEGAQAEGAEWLPVHPGNSTNYIRSFADLWDGIYCKRGFGWDVNPWVWALSFKMIERS